VKGEGGLGSEIAEGERSQQLYRAHVRIAHEDLCGGADAWLEGDHGVAIDHLHEAICAERGVGGERFSYLH
jgi:hypothetical protein